MFFHCIIRLFYLKMLSLPNATSYAYLILRSKVSLSKRDTKGTTNNAIPLLGKKKMLHMNKFTH